MPGRFRLWTLYHKVWDDQACVNSMVSPMLFVLARTRLGSMSSGFALALLVVLLGVRPVEAKAGFLGIDHEWTLDQGGIWGRKYQTALEAAVIATEVGGALWLGSDDDLGRTFWQTIDSSVAASVTAQIMKSSFGRPRPYQGNNPNAWFKGHCCASFPSGEVTLQASFVTPFIMRYAKEQPWVWGLELLPIYDGIARMKSQAHWPTDVLAGWVVGTVAGYWASQRETPLLVEILPAGLTIGFSKRF